jgi:hypothetical protein
VELSFDGRVLQLHNNPQKQKNFLHKNKSIYSINTKYERPGQEYRHRVANPQNAESPTLKQVEILFSPLFNQESYNSLTNTDTEKVTSIIKQRETVLKSFAQGNKRSNLHRPKHHDLRLTVPITIWFHHDDSTTYPFQSKPS